jgi:hypothetical protein
MKTFLAIYIGTAETMAKSGWNELDEATRKAREQKGMQAWGDWVTDHEAAIVQMGGPLGKTKRASASGICDIRNNMTGYTVVQAESHDAAARMFERHPHFSVFPGDSVEIMEVLEIPGM